MYKTFALQWLASLFVGLVSLGVSIAVARSIGPSLFGEYASALAVGAVIALFFDGGIRTLILREQARSSEHLSHYRPMLLGIGASHILISSAILLTFAFFILSGETLKLGVATIICFSAVVFSQYISAYLRGSGKLLGDCGFQVGFRLATATGILLALYLGFSKPWEIIGAWALFSALYIFQSGFLKLRVRVNGLLPIYTAAYPFFLLDLAITLYIRSNIILLNFFQTSSDSIGQFSAAFRVCEAVNMLAGPFGLFIFRYFRLNRFCTAEMKSRVSAIVLSSMVIGAILVATVYLLSDLIVLMLFGDKYPDSSGYLKIMSLMLFFVVPNIILSQSALATNRERSTMYVALGVAFLSLTMSSILIPVYGVNGAAWVVVATEALVFLGMFFIVHNNFFGK